MPTVSAVTSTQFDIDSCGTGGGSPDWYMEGGFSYHEGDESDPRMTRAAVGRGVRLTSRSRPLKPSDLSEFDYILGMDASNIAAIKRAAKYWAGKHALPENYEAKVGSGGAAGVACVSACVWRFGEQVWW